MVLILIDFNCAELFEGGLGPQQTIFLDSLQKDATLLVCMQRADRGQARLQAELDIIVTLFQSTNSLAGPFERHPNKSEGGSGSEKLIRTQRPDLHANMYDMMQAALLVCLRMSVAASYDNTHNVLLWLLQRTGQHAIQQWVHTLQWGYMHFQGERHNAGTELRSRNLTVSVCYQCKFFCFTCCKFIR